MGLQESTCWTLVRGAAAGDVHDRETFAVRYTPVLRAYLAARWKLSGQHERVNDGIQEVFLQCFKSGGALLRADADRPGGFRAYLFGVARNVAGMLEQKWRRQQRDHHGSSDFDPDRVEGSEDSLSQVFDHAWARLVTREARALMASRARPGDAASLRLQALELMYQQGLKAGRIAEQLGLSAADTYQTLHKARKEFKGALLEVMAGYHPHDGRTELERRCAELLGQL